MGTWLREKRLILGAMLLSSVALLCSLVAISIALSDRDAVAASVEPKAVPSTPPVATTTLATTSAPSGSGDPVEPAGSESPTPEDTGFVEPQGEYEVVYEGEEQQVPDGANQDLDEPRVNTSEEASDLTYEDFYGLQIDGAKAIINNERASPEDCAEAIRNAPVVDTIRPASGRVICIRTNASKASEQDISQKMVLMSIKDITNGTLLVELTAWHVPAS